MANLIDAGGSGGAYARGMVAQAQAAILPQVRALIAESIGRIAVRAGGNLTAIGIRSAVMFDPAATAVLDDPDHEQVIVPLGGSGALKTCRLSRTASLSMATGSYTTVVWDAEREDAAGLHSLVTHPDRVTVTAAGLYLLEGRFRFHRVTGTANGDRLWSAFFLNDTVVIDSEDWFSSDPESQGTSESQFSMVATHRLAAGDYVNVQMANEGDGQIDLVCDAGVVSGDNQTCEFLVTRLGG
jgi:hypothetical protein